MRPQRFHVASHPQHSYISALFTFSLTNVSFSEKIFRRSFHLFNVQLSKFQVDPWNQHPFSYTGLEWLIHLNIPVNWNRILFISTGRVIFLASKWPKLFQLKQQPFQTNGRTFSPIPQSKEGEKKHKMSTTGVEWWWPPLEAFPQKTNNKN